MLLADIHGKGMHETQGHEDYLTSTVFGHLRYLPPSVFWHELFTCAKGVPGINDTECRLSEVLADKEIEVGAYQELLIHFWKSHKEHGEPDLLLAFQGGSSKPLLILIEAKLWAGKSGTGKNDQLVRYLKVLDDARTVLKSLPNDYHSFLIYLTQRDALNEVIDSVNELEDRTADSQRLYRMCWQDIAQVAHALTHKLSHPNNLILRDVTRFLSRRGLEYFAGFSAREGINEFHPDHGRFYFTTTFNELPALQNFEITPGAWAS